MAVNRPILNTCNDDWPGKTKWMQFAVFVVKSHCSTFYGYLCQIHILFQFSFSSFKFPGTNLERNKEPCHTCQQFGF